MIKPKEIFQMAVKTLFFSRGRYLLLKKSDKDEIAPLTWDIPGGRIKYGENPLDALKRETKEETGILIDPKRTFPLEVWDMKKENFQLVGINFLYILKNPQNPKLSFEHTSSKWFQGKDILEDKNMPKWLKDSVKRASVIVRKIDNKQK